MLGDGFLFDGIDDKGGVIILGGLDNGGLWIIGEDGWA